MRNTQTKFINALRIVAEEAGFELIVNPQWANTGTFRIEREDSFVPVLVMSYSFQDGYAGFDSVQPPIAMAHLEGKAWPYVQGEELETRVLATVRTYLAEYKAVGVKA